MTAAGGTFGPDGWQPPRATWGSSRPAAVLLGLAVLGLLSSLTPPYDLHPEALLAALVLLPVVVGAFAESVRRGVRTWVDPVAPWGTFVFIALLRHGVGGADGQLAVLVAFPIFWLAFFGTRQDLFAGALLAAVTLLAPLWLIGPPDYPASGWRPALLWTAVALFAAPMIQQGIRQRERQLGAADDRHREAAATLNAILYGTTMVGLLTLDTEGAVVSSSTGATTLTGRTARQLAGQPLLSLLYDREQLEGTAAELGVHPGFEVFEELARTRAPGRVWDCVAPDGGRTAVRIAVTQIRDENSTPIGYLCVAVDETEAQQARVQLGEAEERWRILLDHLPDTTVVLIEKGLGIKLVTGGAVGPRRRTSAGRWLEELARVERIPLDAMLEEAFAGREGAATDAGSFLGDHEMQVSPLPTTSGRPLALVVVRDVSRDRARQRAITAAKERAERLFANAPQGIAVLRTDGVIVQANPALAAVLGRADLEGVMLSSLSYDAGDATVLRHLATLLAGSGGQATAQWTVRRPDGQEVHVVLSSTVLPGQDGEPDQVLTNVVDVSERHRYEQQLAHLADHDPLTGLANRRRFDSELTRHVESCRRYGINGALLVLDLDHFKEVNDTLGHAAGDDLLVSIATALRDRLRATDVVARLGGDEFAVLLPQGDRKAAERVAQNIVDEIRVRMAAHDDTRRHITVSIGGVALDSAELSGSDLLSAADSAMYAAKAGGRNQYVVLG